MRVVIVGGGNVGTFMAAELRQGRARGACSSRSTPTGSARWRPSASRPACSGWWPTAARSASSPGPTSSGPTWSPPSPATTRTTSSSRCWPSRSSPCPASSPASTTRRTSGCSTRCGASTCRCPPRTSSPPSSRRRCRSAASCGCSRFEGGKARLVEVTLAPTTRRRPTRTSSASASPRLHRRRHPPQGPRRGAPRRHAGAGRRRGAGARHRGERADGPPAPHRPLSRGVDPQAAPRRPAAGLGRRVAPADPQGLRPGHLRVRRHLVDGVRHRGDPPRPRADRGRGGARVPDPDLDRGHGADGDRRAPATGRSSTPTPTAAAPTRCRQDNLGEKPALVAGASLLVDYTLTVAVSISAGTAAITSAFPELRDQRVDALPGLHPHPDGGQPPRPQGVGHGLRHPDLRLRRARSALLIGYGLYRFVLRRPRRRCRRSRSATTSSPRTARCSPA